ncbi:hypothetical protein THAOC_25233 [Thalassiosira oceanica]|uniref:Uncharacterized protein n=1 Tax=Thalassiosira oceanica TaxID=159749 RepID=K0S8G0_THAOC|nr:hypothetical protein THAOC_25233 [Thalassiosira oceanica]|eukprot:EJK55072.1 hypothetical protein THAOC_25233 [Thalassiosira oceanica]
MFGPSWDFSYSLPVSQKVPLRLSGFSIAIEPSVGRSRLASSTDEADLIAVRRRGDTESSAALFGSSFSLPSLLTLCGLSSTIWVGPTPESLRIEDGLASATYQRARTDGQRGGGMGARAEAQVAQGTPVHSSGG